jgi:bifunctional DNA-binding transcriptional regulator/antitoxin component of YhaV-PrlF toxin-antitoxin module
MKAYRTVVSAKGQVVIPAALRKQLGLKQGTPATWCEERGSLKLTPMRERVIDEVVGCLRPTEGEPSMFDELFAERQRERHREDKR